MAKLTVKDVDLKGKKVLVRVDFNVPVKDGVITNDNRITAALPTIKYILEQGGRAILFSHLGRVKEEADKEGKSLAPVAADLAAKLGQDVAFLPGVTRGAELEAAINALKDGEVLLVENTRFEDVDGKHKNCKYDSGAYHYLNNDVKQVRAEHLDKPVCPLPLFISKLKRPRERVEYKSHDSRSSRKYKRRNKSEYYAEKNVNAYT